MTAAIVHPTGLDARLAMIPVDAVAAIRPNKKRPAPCANDLAAARLPRPAIPSLLVRPTALEPIRSALNGAPAIFIASLGNINPPAPNAAPFHEKPPPSSSTLAFGLFGSALALDFDSPVLGSMSFTTEPKIPPFFSMLFFCSSL